jgi:PAS domain S-box-containing protein
MMGFIFSGFGIAMGILLVVFVVLFYFIFRKQKIPKVRVASDYAESNRLKGLMFDNSVHAQIATSVSGKILMFSPTAEEMFGYTENEVLGKSILMLFKSDNGLSWYKERIDDSKRLIELDVLRKNGEVLSAILFVKKLDDAGFVNIGWFTRKSNADIDSRKLLAEKIEMLEKGAIDAKTGIWSWNASENKFYGCEYFRYIFSLLEHEEVTFLGLLERIYIDDRDALPFMMKELIESKKENYTMRYRVKKGDKLRWVSLTGTIEYKDEFPLIIHGVVKFEDNAN